MWAIDVADGDDEPGQRFKACCDYDQFRQEPASVDTPYLYDDGHPQDDPVSFWLSFLEVSGEDPACRTRYNAAKLQQCQMRAIISNAFDASCEPAAMEVSAKMNYKDWLCVVGDVLPVKRHAQHTKAILKRSWLVTLGEKNLYMRAPSSDVSTDSLVVPYVTGFKTERLISSVGREKLRLYKDEGVKTMPEGF
eukprot:6491313-Amphidinium_carterae.5